MVGVDGTDAAPVTALRLRPQRMRLGKETPGVERHHVDVEAAFANPVKDELAFDAEAVREHDGAVDGLAQV